MYYEHYGLNDPPFKITPNTEVFFTGGNRGAVLDAITYAIMNGEGIIKVVGEVGSGKTMLCRMLQAMLPAEVESIYLANPSVAPEDVLHAIAFELQLKLPKTADRLKVMQTLQTYLLKRHAAGKQVIIFVEEAQGMPLATLEEIRLLSNLETNHDKLLQIVLFGQPELDENLDEVNIRQLRERITHSFHLTPLQSNEIGEYILFRLRAAGYFGPQIFTPAAIKKLSNAAQGLVRRVNILADKALLASFADNMHQVTPKHVEAAISDSEFGRERSKQAKQSHNPLLWLAILGLGLLVGYLSSLWYQGRPVVVSTETALPAEKPIIDSRVDKVGTPVAAVADAVPPQPSSIVASIEEQPDVLAQRLLATEVWLAKELATTASIQIMGGKESLQLKKDLLLIGERVGLENIYVYRTQVQNAPFLNVLYGSFPDKLAAQEAISSLPEVIKKFKPQVRTIAGVLQETKQLP